MSAPARCAAALALAALLAGCASTGGESQQYHVLEPAPSAPAPVARPRTTTLLVTPTTAPGFYETRDIAFSRAPGIRAYYQYHAWTDRPGRSLGESLVSRLARGGAFAAVAAATGGVRGDLVLNTHLAEFYHDAASNPGAVRVRLAAELVDPARRVLVARRVFERSAPAATFDAAGAVQAFNRAAGALLDDVAAWLDEAAPR